MTTCPWPTHDRGPCPACENDKQKNRAVPVSAEMLAELQADANRWRACMIYGFPAVRANAPRTHQRWTMNGDIFGASPQSCVDNFIAKKIIPMAAELLKVKP